MTEKYGDGEYSGHDSRPVYNSSRPVNYDNEDVFGHEEGHDVRTSTTLSSLSAWLTVSSQIKYKTLSWQLVAVLMIAEIVSNGMLSLPSSLAVVGIVPGLIIIVFLGVFATYTSWLLVKFKMRHPEVHNMGDAGYILFGPVGRELLAFGTVVFAVFATGGQLLAGQIALASLSDNKLCLMLYTGIFAIPTLLCSLPRTLDGLSWISIPSVLSIAIAGIVGMVGAGIHPEPGRTISVTVPSTFFEAFISITNPVFAYAGHFMFFVMVSEMKRPQDAMKAAYTLQGFATMFYAVFAAVTYVYLGNTVTSPSFSSLEITWQKAAYGVALPNFLIAGSLYAHTASKLLFVRIFRQSRHLHSHTVLGWGTWVLLVIIMNGAAFVLAVGVPIFNYLIGIAASLFAAWFTYGIAGMFWLHDAYQDGDGVRTWKRKWFQSSLAVSTILVGAFICVAGMYVTVRAIVEAYQSGAVAIIQTFLVGLPQRTVAVTRPGREIGPIAPATVDRPSLRTLIHIVNTIAQRAAMVDSAASPAIEAGSKCHLLSLAAELRNRIYELVLVNDKGRIHADLDDYIYCSDNHAVLQPALTRVSREVRNDTLPIFYGQNTFQVSLDLVEVSEAKDSIRAWMTGIGDRARLFHRMELTMCCYHGISLVIEATGHGQMQYQLVMDSGKEIVTGEHACFMGTLFSERGVDKKICALVQKAGVDGFGAQDYIAIVEWFDNA
ncbi:hypothetical protein LTR36_001510 [Oleoguttula mirabilis]|uniref:Amino acid transporter transmembrane domain-containing protein n=1 Tax=Oleoguttula mirabilis TaxID=1507867 RepID=A0AAV9JQE9_9PEZI|nr:hypothetical protein LTR36_001510 [Oleoguttula mirabilis]